MKEALTMISERNYARARISASAGAAIAPWLGLWFINGYFTVVAMRDFGAWVAVNAAAAGYGTLALLGSWLTSPFVAWLLHLLSSLVEGKGWTSIRSLSPAAMTWVLVLGLDVYTTFRGTLAIALPNTPVSGIILVGFIGVSMLLALLPEPMMIAHLKAIGVIRRDAHAVRTTR